jgi:hypothetical protein
MFVAELHREWANVWQEIHVGECVRRRLAVNEACILGGNHFLLRNV